MLTTLASYVEPTSGIATIARILAMAVNSNRSTGFLLDTLDDLAARTNDGTDEFLRDDHLHDTRYLWFEVCTRFCDSIGQFAQDMLPAGFCLHQSLFEDFV